MGISFWVIGLLSVVAKNRSTKHFLEYDDPYMIGTYSFIILTKELSYSLYK